MADLLVDMVFWSVGGFGAGWATCWIAVWSALREFRGNVKNTANLKDVQGHVWRVLAGVSILILVVVSVVRYNSATHCQYGYNMKVASALNQRADANRAAVDAQINKMQNEKNFWLSIGTDQLANRESLAQYLVKLDSSITALKNLNEVRDKTQFEENPNCGI